MPLQRLRALLLALALNSCAIIDTTPVSQALIMPLAPPTAPARRVEQKITAHWQQDQQATLLAVLELDKQHIAMAGLSTDGVSLFSVEYDGQQLSVDKSPLLTAEVKPEFMIADMQLIYWPAAELQKILPDPWRLVVSPGQRELYYQEQKIASVHYLSPQHDWAKQVEFYNHRYHYQLQITTLGYELLSQ